MGNDDGQRSAFKFSGRPFDIRFAPQIMDPGTQINGVSGTTLRRTQIFSRVMQNGNSTQKQGLLGPWKSDEPQRSGLAGIYSLWVYGCVSGGEKTELSNDCITVFSFETIPLQGSPLGYPNSNSSYVNAPVYSNQVLPYESKSTRLISTCRNRCSLLRQHH